MLACCCASHFSTLTASSVVEHVFERLIKWAVAALETSSNQPLLPHCILVLNASDNDLDPSMWDAGVNTGSILDSLAKTVNKNETFKKYGQWWKERGKTIDNLEQLILCYYSSVVVCLLSLYACNSSNRIRSCVCLRTGVPN